VIHQGGGAEGQQPSGFVLGFHLHQVALDGRELVFGFGVIYFNAFFCQGFLGVFEASLS
jgi:hypothetical protein